MADAVCRWSSLPDHLLEEIAIRTLMAVTPTGTLAEDFNGFMAFRKVCTSWRAAATKDLFVANYSTASQLPYLMLPEKEGTHEREFYDVFTRKICGKLSLPEAYGKRCIEARFGWLLTLANSGEVQLLNPISRSCIELPNFKSLPGYSQLNPPYRFICRAVLSANPSNTPDFVLAVNNTDTNIEFWKNGDKSWTAVENHGRYKDSFRDMYYSEKDKKFYTITACGYIWSWDPKGNLTVADLMRRVSPKHIGITGLVDVYLVISPSAGDGELLLVARNGIFPDVMNNYTYGTTVFKVFRINVKDEESEVEEVVRLEDEAIFVGHNSAICVSTAKFPGLVKSSCIYFSDDSISSYFASYRLGKKDESEDEEEGEDEGEEGEDHGWEGYYEEEEDDEEYPEWAWEGGSFDATKGGGKNMGIYNLEDGSIERFDECVETLSFVCPALWISPPSLQLDNPNKVPTVSGLMRNMLMGFLTLLRFLCPKFLKICFLTYCSKQYEQYVFGISS